MRCHDWVAADAEKYHITRFGGTHNHQPPVPDSADHLEHEDADLLDAECICKSKRSHSTSAVHWSPYPLSCRSFWIAPVIEDKPRYWFRYSPLLVLTLLHVMGEFGLMVIGACG